MFLFYPDYSYRRIYEIPTAFFLRQGIRAALIDVDNTLTTHDNPVPHEQVLDWLDCQRQAGVRLLAFSNNSEERVAPFARQLGLEYVADAKKPLPFPLWKALKSMGIAPGEAAVIGDQIFTDVLCGRFARCVPVLVEPMQKEDWGFLAVKRRWEKLLLQNYTLHPWNDPGEGGEEYR